MALTALSEQFVFNQQATIAPADTTALKNIYNSPVFPVHVDALWVTNTDTVQHIIDLYYFGSSGSELLGSVVVPGLAGLAGNPSKELLSVILGSPNNGLTIALSHGLKVASEDTVGTAKVVAVSGFGGYLPG